MLPDRSFHPPLVTVAMTLCLGCAGNGDEDYSSSFAPPVEACNADSAPCLVANVRWPEDAPMTQTWVRCDSAQPVSFMQGGYEGLGADWTLQCVGDELSVWLLIDLNNPLTNDGRVGTPKTVVAHFSHGDITLPMNINCDRSSALVGCTGVSEEASAPAHDMRIDLWLPAEFFPDGTISWVNVADLGLSPDAAIR
jgi:hypothetical protein